MILVTGMKRSGTSMWMQVLEAAGYKWIGQHYLGAWEKSIQAANPRGFYESRLRQGIFFATNPDPATGAFLPPDATRRHVVKVFIPGLIRTDLAYLDRALATLRPWREQVVSLRRLYAMEDAFFATLPDDQREAAVRRAARVRDRIPAEVEWWFDYYELIRDVGCRRYPFHLTTYDRVLDDPEGEIRRVVAWIGGGDAKAAIAAVAPTLSTQRGAAPELTHVLDAPIAALMDEVYDAANRQRGLSADLVDRLNTAHTGMVERWGPPSRDRAREDDAPDEAPGP